MTLYLVTPHTESVRDQIESGRLGAFVTPATGNRVRPGWTWAADNGAFTRFDEAAYLRMLSRYNGVRDTCLFIAVPDVLEDWASTRVLWDAWKNRPELAGWPLAIVCQDGATRESVPWDEAAAVFIGGSTEWKLSEDAASVIAEAKHRGMWAHMGRVNSGKRFGAAVSMGCDSADGTYLAFGPDTNLPKLLGWLTAEDAAPRFLLPATRPGVDVIPRVV